MSLDGSDTRDRPRFGKTAEVFILLILAQGRSYGYEIRRRLAELGYDGVVDDPGVLYRFLRELEASGAIASDWEVETAGPARRYYSLTPQGREQLQHGATRLRRMQANIERFLEAYSVLDQQPVVAAGA